MSPSELTATKCKGERAVVGASLYPNPLLRAEVSRLFCEGQQVDVVGLWAIPLPSQLLRPAVAVQTQPLTICKRLCV